MELAAAAVAGAAGAVVWLPTTARVLRAEGAVRRLSWSATAACILAAAVLAAAVAHAALGQAAWPVLIVFASAIPALTWIDVRVWRLPFAVTVPVGLAGVAGFAIAVIVGGESAGGLWRGVAAAAAVAAAGVGLGLAAPEEFGLGDAALMSVIALYTAWVSWQAVIVALGVGLTAAAIAGLAVWAATKSARTAFPLGPFLLVGWLTSVLIV